MEIFYTLAIFSLIGFIGVIIYLFMEHDKKNQKSEHCELLEERITRLESYVYELEAKVLTPDSKLKEKIIQMYNDGKDIPLIENILDIPRLKIEMILKQYKREKS
jgi:uncharacterized membrane-anchored protein YhcB (DUF1043 family)